MGKFIDLTGQRFSDLTVVARIKDINTKRVTKWQCICACGATCVVQGGNLHSKTTKSCGCLKRAVTTERNKSKRKIYAPSRDHHREYTCWEQMTGRCYNPKHTAYPAYGAVGVTVCTAWRKSFAAFLQDMGTRPSMAHTLDRYPDQAGNYVPGNVRWATPAEQARNKKSNVWLTHNNKTMCITDWAKITKLGKATIAYRKRAGWTDSAAITTTPNPANKGAKYLK